MALSETSIREILNEVLDKKLKPIVDSIDELKSSLSQLEDSHSALKEENSKLKRQLATIHNELETLKFNCDEQEQYNRRECLEIHGIPTMEKEDTNDIITKVGSLINVKIEPNDISVSHRLPTKNKDRKDNIKPIIVKFTRRDVRDQLYSSRRLLKDHTIDDIGMGRLGSSKIFIQESLTFKKKDLFKKCLKFKKENKFKFIWTSYGTIFLRKNEHSPSHKITYESDLARLSGMSFHPASYAQVVQS